VRRRHWLWGAGALLVAAAIAGGVLAARGEDDAAPVTRAASGQTVELGGTSPITGEPVSLAAFVGKPVVINVWASWCTGCREEGEDLRRFAERHPEAQLIGLDTQDGAADAKAFYREVGWSHPSIHDPNGRKAAKLGLQGLPTTIFLDAQHREVARIVGATDLAGFEQGLAATES